MKGIKALQSDMSSIHGNMTYKIGEWYNIDGSPSVGCKGFHFCDTLSQVLLYVPLENSRFFKVETAGSVAIGNDLNAAEKIRLVEEIPIDEVLDSLKSNSFWYMRRKVAEYGREQDLDILINDKDWRVRKEVVKHGRKKDIHALANDNNLVVRSLAQALLKH